MSIEKNIGDACKVNYDAESTMSRRDFLGLSALWSCIIAWIFTCIGLGKFPMPALLPDVSTTFKIGKVEDIPLGGEKVFEEKQVLVKRDEEGLRAVSLICTHLGCIVAIEEAGGFACPCHGSKFNEKGKVTGGPAPKGLNWLEVSQLPSGKLVVDTNKFVTEETRFTV